MPPWAIGASIAIAIAAVFGFATGAAGPAALGAAVGIVIAAAFGVRNPTRVHERPAGAPRSGDGARS